MDKRRMTGDELRVQYAPTVRLGDIMGKIEQDLIQIKQVVCRYLINDKVLTDQNETDLTQLQIHEIQSLEIWSGSLNDLVPAIIQSWKEALPKLLDQVDVLSDRIRFDGIHNQLPCIQSLIESCLYLVESLVALRQALGDAVTAQYMDWHSAETKMQQLVTEAITALESKNANLLADILEFDFGHNLGQWMTFLDFAETQIAIQVDYAE